MSTMSPDWSGPAQKTLRLWVYHKNKGKNNTTNMKENQYHKIQGKNNNTKIKEKNNTTNIKEKQYHKNQGKVHQRTVVVRWYE